MPKKASKIKLLDHFEIILDQPNRHYHPHEEIKGDVIVVVSQKTPIIGVQLRVTSKAFVFGKSANQKLAQCKPYVFNMQLLGDSLQPEAIEPSVLLEPGERHIEFALILPDDLPSTFAGQYGAIQYQLVAALKDTQQLVHKCTRQFYFINPIVQPTGNHPWLRPLHCETIRSVRKLGFAAGRVVARFVIKRNVYAAGHNIRFHARVDNDSRITLKGSRVALIERIKYLVNGKIYKITNFELACLERGKIKAHSAEEWINEALPVPLFHPQNTYQCSVIIATYILAFEVRTGRSNKIRLELPLHLASYKESRSLEPNQSESPVPVIMN